LEISNRNYKLKLSQEQTPFTTFYSQVYDYVYLHIIFMQKPLELNKGVCHFLLALKQGTADWRDFPLPETERLPAVQWKLLNIQRMSKAKHAAAIAKLEMVLFG
jgi:hypothetical protein